MKNKILSLMLSILRYEMSNCLFEAAFENILHSCHCAPGFHTMGGTEAMNDYEVCSGENLTCMNEHLNRMGEKDKVYLFSSFQFRRI